MVGMVPMVGTERRMGAVGGWSGEDWLRCRREGGAGGCSGMAGRGLCAISCSPTPLEDDGRREVWLKGALFGPRCRPGDGVLRADAVVRGGGGGAALVNVEPNPSQDSSTSSVASTVVRDEATPVGCPRGCDTTLSLIARDRG